MISVRTQEQVSDAQRFAPPVEKEDQSSNCNIDPRPSRDGIGPHDPPPTILPSFWEDDLKARAGPSDRHATQFD